MNTPTLETERLILRKFTEDDLEALYQIYSDEEVNRFLPWFPLKSMDEARTFFEERYAATYTQPQAYAYAICLKKDGKMADFTYCLIAQYGDAMEPVRYDTFSALMDDFYALREQQERVRQRGADLLRTATTARDRLRRKLAQQEKD